MLTDGAQVATGDRAGETIWQPDILDIIDRPSKQGQQGLRRL
ncbi:MAG: hypothetical protein DDT28_00625 [Dehalococcoidia bacterium]|nr:hypothetical protein [Chloroflexota bacterium]